MDDTASMDWLQSNTYLNPQGMPGSQDLLPPAESDDCRNTTLTMEVMPFILSSNPMCGEHMGEGAALHQELTGDCSAISTFHDEELWTGDGLIAPMAADLLCPLSQSAVSHDGGSENRTADVQIQSTNATNILATEIRAVHEPHPRQPIERLMGKETSLDSLTCTWPGCKKPGPFSRKSALSRHLKTQHREPLSFQCTHSDCGRLFNRKDNMMEHIRSNHRARS